MLNRRAFLGTLIGGTVASAAIQTWPFRVYSFPAEIFIPKAEMAVRYIRAYDLLGMKMIAKKMDYMLHANWREQLHASGYLNIEIVEGNVVDTAVMQHFHLTPER